MKKLFFKRTEELENDINKYLDIVEKSILIFNRDISNYVKKNWEEFEDCKHDIRDIENEADEYQKDIKYKLYKYMLIPESRGDVLTLLENIDNIVDMAKKILTQVAIEKPQIPEFLEKDFIEMTEITTKAIDALVRSLRSYFEQISMVNESVNKVHFYEHEVDKIEERLNRKIFSSEKFENFCKKIHLRYFTEKIASLSDEAETISEKVSVAAIKRSI